MTVADVAAAVSVVSAIIAIVFALRADRRSGRAVRAADEANRLGERSNEIAKESAASASRANEISVEANRIAMDAIEQGKRHLDESMAQQRRAELESLYTNFGVSASDFLAFADENATLMREGAPISLNGAPTFLEHNRHLAESHRAARTALHRMRVAGACIARMDPDSAMRAYVTDLTRRLCMLEGHHGSADQRNIPALELELEAFFQQMSPVPAAYREKIETAVAERAVKAHHSGGSGMGVLGDK